MDEETGLPHQLNERAGKDRIKLHRTVHSSELRRQHGSILGFQNQNKKAHGQQRAGDHPFQKSVEMHVERLRERMQIRHAIRICHFQLNSSR